jgi:hypothetical protein
MVTTQPAVNSPTNYSYDPWGRRMWKETPGGRDGNGNPVTTGEIYFYGVTGQKLETYSFALGTAGFNMPLEGINLYFGGKLLQSKGVWVATDRLGSVRANFPLAYEVMNGNRSERTTLRDFLKKIEKTHGRARLVWMM